jgi:hypothetical protein
MEVKERDKMDEEKEGKGKGRGRMMRKATRREL